MVRNEECQPDSRINYMRHDIVGTTFEINIEI